MMNEKDFMQEELVSKELEIEINTEILKLHTAPCYDELKSFALHFIEWQKQQMMAKAVDGEVGYWNQRGLSVLMSLPREFEEDDKCKIILIKED